jgi:hypothetical protein
MLPKISICRKKDQVYLKLTGNFNPSSATEILQVVERVVKASLKFSSPDSKVSFSFRTHTTVSLGKAAVPGLEPLEPQVLPKPSPGGPRVGKLLH